MSKKRNGRHISGDPRKNSKPMYYKGFGTTDPIEDEKEYGVGRMMDRDSSYEMTITSCGGRRIEPLKRCCICGGILGNPYGNNPFPFPSNGEDRCCGDCDSRVVIPLRRSQMEYLRCSCHVFMEDYERDITPKSEFCQETLKRLVNTNDLMELCKINYSIQKRIDSLSSNPFKGKRIGIEQMYSTKLEIDESLEETKIGILLNFFLLVELENSKVGQTITIVGFDYKKNKELKKVS